MSDSKVERKESKQNQQTIYHEEYKKIGRRKMSIGSYQAELATLKKNIQKHSEDEESTRALLNEVENEIARTSVLLETKKMQTPSNESESKISRTAPLLETKKNSPQTHSLSEKEAKLALFKAVKSNDLAEVEKLVESGIDINILFGIENSKPAIWLAIFNKDPKIFEYLLSKNANLQIGDITQEIVLHATWSFKDKNKNLISATEKGALPIAPHLQVAALDELEKLKEYKKRTLAERDTKQISVLHYAAANGRLETVQWLLTPEGGAKIDDKDSFGNTALLWAAYNGQFKTVQWLLTEGGADIEEHDQNGSTALINAACNGHLKTVRWLLEKGGAKISERSNDGGTALLWAVTRGHFKVVKWLLRKGGAKVDERDKHGSSALLNAAHNGHLKIVKWLLTEGGAKIDEHDENGDTALLWAARNGHLEIVKWLLKEGGAKIDERNQNTNTALILAAYNGHLETVKWLLKDGGAKIDERSKSGDTALLAAAENGHLKMVKWLLTEGGAKIAECNEDGDTALLNAAHGGQLETVKWLLKEGGAKIDERSNYGFTALMNAASNGHLETVKWLLQEGGSKIDERNKKGTALLKAARGGYIDTVKWLLKEGGAKINEHDENGDTALLWAAYKGYEALVQILISEYGADPNQQNNNGETLNSIVQGRPTISQNSILRNPEALNELYQSYFTKQKIEMTKAASENALPEELIIPDLRDIVIQYSAGPGEEKDLPQEIKTAADNLLLPLKEHAEAKAMQVHQYERDLSRALVHKISLQNPCNALTINRAVYEFLNEVGGNIRGTKLAEILTTMLERTNYFGKPKNISGNNNSFFNSRKPTIENHSITSFGKPAVYSAGYHSLNDK